MNELSNYCWGVSGFRFESGSVEVSVRLTIEFEYGYLNLIRIE